MKSNFYLKLLFVSVFIVSLPLFSFANLSSENNPVGQWVHNYNVSPVNCGYKLIRTNTIGGLKCEHYEINGLKLRIFYNSKGDYITGKEDIDGFDVEPDNMNSFFYPGGMFRLHVKDGTIEANNNLGLTKLSYANGNILFCSSGSDFAKYCNWQDFKSGKVVNANMIDIIEKFSNNGSYDGKINNENYFKPKDECALVIATNPKDTLIFSKYNCKLFDKDFHAIKINNHLFSVNKEDLRLKLIAKEFEGDYIPCLASDSIVSIIKDNEMFTIKFANGDYFEYSKEHSKGSEPIFAGSLHRGNSIMSFIGDPNISYSTIKYPDGSVFRGNIVSNFDGYNPMKKDVLSVEKWFPHTGTRRYPDGKSIAYTRGKTEAENIAAEEAKKKKAEAEEKAAYDYLCKKFGKKYVDATETGNILIGMPEELFVAAFKPSLKKTEGNKKCYYVYGVGIRNSSTQMSFTKKVTKVVWVVNGKVASVTNSSPSKVKVI